MFEFRKIFLLLIWYRNIFVITCSLSSYDILQFFINFPGLHCKKSEHSILIVLHVVRNIFPYTFDYFKDVRALLNSKYLELYKILAISKIVEYLLLYNLLKFSNFEI